jgi:hypothetical protein
MRRIRDNNDIVIAYSTASLNEEIHTMPTLESAEVYRSGVTAPRWNFETRKVLMNNFSQTKPSLHFKFEMASKGGGTTEVSMRITLPSFDAILRQMYEIAPDQMMALMARQMSKQYWPDND